jgi:hypothetical protein
MLIRHEYGHWIDWTDNGSFYYYNQVAPASASWAARCKDSSPRGYSAYWTEKKANTLAYYHFGRPNWWNINWLIDLNNSEWYHEYYKGH